MTKVRAVTFGLIAGLVVWTAQAKAQQQQPASADQEAVELSTAPVIVDGVNLFRVRGVSVYPAETRAAAIADRIKALAADRTVPVESLAVRETPHASVVAAGDRQLVSVVDEDA